MIARVAEYLTPLPLWFHLFTSVRNSERRLQANLGISAKKVPGWARPYRAWQGRKMSAVYQERGEWQTKNLSRRPKTPPPPPDTLHVTGRKLTQPDLQAPVDATGRPPASSDRHSADTTARRLSAPGNSWRCQD